MNMTLDAMDFIVFMAIAFAIFFTLAWGVSPALREWIERPKYRFQESVQRFDRENHR